MKQLLIAATAAVLTITPASAEFDGVARIRTVFIEQQFDTSYCNQVRNDMQQIATRVRDISGVQQDPYDDNVAALSAPLVVYWDDLFFNAGMGETLILVPLSHRYADLMRIAIVRECPVVAEVRERMHLLPLSVEV